MTPLEFSAAIGLFGAVVVVGFVCFLIGGALIFHKMDLWPWLILVPGLNMFLLFYRARTLVLFVLYAIAMIVFGVVAMDPTQGVSGYWYIPLAVAFFFNSWMSVILAQKFRAGIAMQIFSAILPPYAYCILGAGRYTYEPEHITWLQYPEIALQHLIYKHPDEEGYGSRRRRRGQAVPEGLDEATPLSPEMYAEAGVAEGVSHDGGMPEPDVSAFVNPFVDPETDEPGSPDGVSVDAAPPEDVWHPDGPVEVTDESEPLDMGPGSEEFPGDRGGVAPDAEPYVDAVSIAEDEAVLQGYSLDDLTDEEAAAMAMQSLSPSDAAGEIIPEQPGTVVVTEPMDDQELFDEDGIADEPEPVEGDVPVVHEDPAVAGDDPFGADPDDGLPADAAYPDGDAAASDDAWDEEEPWGEGAWDDDQWPEGSFMPTADYNAGLDSTSVIPLETVQAALAQSVAPETDPAPPASTEALYETDAVESYPEGTAFVMDDTGVLEPIPPIDPAPDPSLVPDPASVSDPDLEEPPELDEPADAVADPDESGPIVLSGAHFSTSDPGDIGHRSSWDEHRPRHGRF